MLLNACVCESTNIGASIISTSSSIFWTSNLSFLCHHIRKQASFLCDKQWLFLLYSPHSDPQPIMYHCHLHSVDRKCRSVYCARSFLAQPEWQTRALSACVWLISRTLSSSADLWRFLLSTKDLKHFHSAANTKANTAAQCRCRKCFHGKTVLRQYRLSFLNNTNIYILILYAFGGF